MATENTRKYYLDVLRICAISAVVLMHCAGFVDDQIDPASISWISSIVFGYITRFAVPLFVMISGSLLLGREEINIKRLFSKNILRLVCAYYFWAFVYTLVYSFFGYYQGELSVLAIKNLISGTLSGGYFHLWYMPMIIGLYVLAPVLQAFLRGATKSLVKYCLVVGFVICFVIPLLYRVPLFEDIFGEVLALFANEAWGLYPFYFVLGYVIDQTEISPKRVRMIGFLGVTGGVVSVLAVWLASARTGVLHKEFAANNTVNILLLAVAIFVCVKNGLKAQWKPAHPKLLFALSRYAFGVYLVHELVIVTLQPFVFRVVPEVFGIPALLFAGLSVSYLITWGIDRIRPVAKYII